MSVAILTIGDELLFSEKDNSNLGWLIDRFAGLGWSIAFAGVLPDDQRRIASCLRWLKTQDEIEWILVSGGIGGTHDDVTRQAIAEALDLPIEQHQECYDILKHKYPNHTFNEQNIRLTHLPKNADLIPNPIGAPGFIIDQICGLPGFPNMMRPMVEWLLEQPFFTGGELSETQTLEAAFPLPEGKIALAVEAFAESHPSLVVGIYASSRQLSGTFKTTVRARQVNQDGEDAKDFWQLCEFIEKVHAVSRL